MKIHLSVRRGVGGIAVATIMLVALISLAEHSGAERTLTPTQNHIAEKVTNPIHRRPDTEYQAAGKGRLRALFIGAAGTLFPAIWKRSILTATCT